MNASLRRAHRAAAVGLAIACPSILGAALAARPLERAPIEQSRSVRPAAPPALSWRRVATGGDGLELDLVAERADHLPDLLCYWAPADGAADLESALLLGAVPPDRLVRVTIPRNAATVPGRLLLYSLAHGDVVAEEPLSGAGEAAR